MRLCSIASGSKGNCILINDNDTNILIDVGISKKRVLEGLEYFNTSPEDIDAIFITHEHSDHIKGLGVFLRAYPTKVFGTAKTLQYIVNEANLGKLDTDLFYSVNKDERLQINDMFIKPLAISHDAADPVCYKIKTSTHKIATVTDLGTYDEYLINNLKDLDGVLIESNHDMRMLQVGPYPYQLKQRIWGNKGHLSNEACGNLINSIISDKLKHVVLGHLSGENNNPELAFEAVRNEINFAPNEFNANMIKLEVALREEPSCCIEF